MSGDGLADRAPAHPPAAPLQGCQGSAGLGAGHAEQPVLVKLVFWGYREDFSLRSCKLFSSALI